MGYNGKVKIENGQIFVSNPEKGGDYATIVPATKGKLIINGVEKKTRSIIKEDDVIEYLLENELPKREINFKLAENNMKVITDFNYVLGVNYLLRDSKEKEVLQIEIIEDKSEVPPLFTEKEVLEKLHELGIVYGIKNDVIRNVIVNRDVKDILIAEGQLPVDALDDTVKFLDKEPKTTIKEDSLQAIDYRNLSTISSVVKGDLIATVIRGHESILGTNVFGEEVKSKKNKRKIITSGKGCKISEDNVIATENGQVSIKSNVINVNRVYEHTKDVDITSGNINFQGDVNIRGSVTEGMAACALNNLNVYGGAYRSTLISMGDMDIKGNIMSSKIAAGGSNVIKQTRIKNLNNLESALEQLIDNIVYLKSNNHISNNQKLGLFVKSLIEKKYKLLNKTCTETMTTILKDKDSDSKVLQFIKSKLLGAGPLSIDSVDELVNGIGLIRDEREQMQDDINVISNVCINNSQEATIQASGDIIINGKGVFSTDMHSLQSIVFNNSLSVCRGGNLKAKSFIKARTVGSTGGGQTTLEVDDKEGNIEIDTAYHNTIIIIANRKYVVDRPIRNVKCFIDKQGELVVEKFFL